MRFQAHARPDGWHAILYNADGTFSHLGPFPTKQAALKAAQETTE